MRFRLALPLLLPLLEVALASRFVVPEWVLPLALVGLVLFVIAARGSRVTLQAIDRSALSPWLRRASSTLLWLWVFGAGLLSGLVFLGNNVHLDGVRTFEERVTVLVADHNEWAGGPRAGTIFVRDGGWIFIDRIGTVEFGVRSVEIEGGFVRLIGSSTSAELAF